MSEDPTAAAGAVGEGGTAPDLKEPAATNGGADPAPLASLGDDPGAAASPSSWPEDWRERLTGGDEAAMALAKRIASPEAMWTKLLSQEQTIRRGAHKVAPTLPEGATEEQVAEYRKALGVPETPDGYGLRFAEELKPTEADNELLNGFLADMHTRHIPPAATKAAFEWYQAQLVRARETQAAEAQRTQHANAATLRKEYGADHMRNLGLADEFLEAYPGLKKLVHPAADIELLRDVIKLARASADEEALYGGDGRGGGMSLDQKIEELLTKQDARRLTAAEDKELDDLYAARIRRDESRSSRAA